MPLPSYFDPLGAGLTGGRRDVVPAQEPIPEWQRNLAARIMQGKAQDERDMAAGATRDLAAADRAAKVDPIADEMKTINQRRTDIRYQHEATKDQLHGFLANEGADLFETDPISGKPIKNPDGTFMPKLGAEVESLRAKAGETTGLIAGALSPSRRAGDPTPEAIAAQQRLAQIEPAYQQKSEKYQRIQDRMKALEEADNAHQARLGELGAQREARYTVSPQDVSGAISSVNADRVMTSAESPAARPVTVADLKTSISNGSGRVSGPAWMQTIQPTPDGGSSAPPEALDALAKSHGEKNSLSSDNATRVSLAEMRDSGVTHIGTQPIGDFVDQYGGDEALNDAKLVATYNRIGQRMAKIDEILPGMTDKGAKPLQNERAVLTKLLDQKRDLVEQRGLSDQVRDPTMTEKVEQTGANLAVGAATSLLDIPEFVGRQAERLKNAISTGQTDLDHTSYQEYLDAMKEAANEWGPEVPKQVRDKLASSFVVNDLAKGVGGLGGMLLPGAAVGRLAKFAGLSEKAIAAAQTAANIGAGSAATANSLRAEVNAANAPMRQMLDQKLEANEITPEDHAAAVQAMGRQSGQAELIGAALGTTLGAVQPLANMIGVMAKVPAGKAFGMEFMQLATRKGPEAVANFMQTRGAKLLEKTIDSLGEGGGFALQQFGQKLAENLAARGDLGNQAWDTNRPIVSDDAMKSAASGFVLGFLTRGVHEAYRAQFPEKPPEGGQPAPATAPETPPGAAPAPTAEIPSPAPTMDAGLRAELLNTGAAPATAEPVAATTTPAPITAPAQSAPGAAQPQATVSNARYIAPTEATPPGDEIRGPAAEAPAADVRVPEEPVATSETKPVETPATPQPETPAEETKPIATTPETKLKFDKSSTQVTLPPEEAKPIVDFAKTIPDEDLYKEGDKFGRETEPHITALYGIKNDDVEPVKKALENVGPIRATVGNTSVLQNADKPYDVVKLSIFSGDLKKVNAAIKAATDNSSDFPDYSPHMTLAYVKKGLGMKYNGKGDFAGKELTFNSLDFRTRDGRSISVPLTGSSEKAPDFAKKRGSFMADVNPIARARGNKALDAKEAYRGEMMTRRAFAEKAATEGYTVKQSKDGQWVAWHPSDGTGTDITKVEGDYIRHLQTADATTVASDADFKLPKDLAGAKPRYSYGEKQFTLEFDNELDKALYVLAQTTPSKRDADFARAVTSQTGMSEADARAAGAEVRRKIKAIARDANAGELTVPKIHGAEDSSSAEPAATAPATPAPSTPQTPNEVTPKPTESRVPTVARGENKPAKFISAVAQASGLKASDKATKFLSDFAPRLHRANSKAFEDMEVHVLTQAQWDADPIMRAQTPESSAAYQPDTNTLFFNSDKMRGKDAVGVISSVVHEAGHFAEKFALGDDFAQKEWAKLNEGERATAYMQYVGNALDVAKAGDLLNNRRARAEWVAMQFSRVVRGDTNQMPEPVRTRLTKFLESVRELVKKWIGHNSLTTAELDSKILDMLGYTKEEAPAVAAQPAAVTETPAETKAKVLASVRDNAERGGLVDTEKKREINRDEFAKGWGSRDNDAIVNAVKGDAAWMKQTLRYLGKIPKNPVDYRAALEKARERAALSGSSNEVFAEAIFDAATHRRVNLASLVKQAEGETITTEPAKKSPISDELRAAGTELFGTAADKPKADEDKKPEKPQPVLGQPGKFYRSLPDTEREANAKVVRQVYERRSQEPDLDAAAAIISERGEARAMELSMSKADDGVPLPVKSAIYVKLIEAADKRLADAKGPADQAKALRERQALSTMKAPAATEQGQQIAMYGQINKTVRGGAFSEYLEDVADKQNRGLGKRGKKAIEDATDTIAKADDEAIDAASKELQRAVEAQPVTKPIWDRYREDAAQRMMKWVDNAAELPKEQAPLADFTKRVIDEMRARLAPLLPDKVKAEEPSAIDVLKEALANKEKYADVLTTVRNSFAEKYGDGNPMLDAIDTELANMGLRPFTEKLLDRAINEAHGAMQTSVADLAKEHFTQTDAKAGDLADALVKLAGIPEADGTRLAAEISERTKKLVADARAKALNALKKRYETTTTTRKVLSAVERAVQLNNIGAFGRADVIDAAADALKLPKADPKKLQEIAKLADAVETAPNEAAKARAELDLANGLKIARGITKTDVATSIWYANMLSGYTTHLANTGSNMMNGTLQLASVMATNPRHAGEALRGWIDGFGEGWTQAKGIMKTGRGSRDFDAKTGDASTTLELVDYKRDFPKLNETIAKGLNTHAAALNYVFRAMKAADAVFYYPAREAYARVAVAKILEGEYQGKELYQKVRETLGIAPDAFARARDQATREGFTGIEHSLRTANIIQEQRRSTDAGRQGEAAGEKFGLETTFNNDPVGWAGVLFHHITDLTNNFKPGGVPVLKAFLPFVRIPTNLFNASMNYTPVGTVRAFRGMRDPNLRETDGSYARIENTADERNRLLVQSIGGSLAMGGLAALALAQDKDKEPLFTITATGPADYRARQQLEATGWNAHSIKIGDAWISYKDSPLLTPLALVGNVVDAVRYQKTKDDLTLGNMVVDAALKAPRVIFDTSMLSGLGQLFDMLESKASATQVGQFLAKLPVTMAVPNLLGQIDRTFLPEVRQADGPLGQAGAVIPFVRDTGSVKTDVLAQPIERAPLDRFVGLETNDPLREVLRDKNVFISVPSRSTKIGNAPMTPEQYDAFIRISGEGIRKQLTGMVPQLRRLNREQVEKFVDHITEQNRQRAKVLVSHGMGVKPATSIFNPFAAAP